MALLLWTVIGIAAALLFNTLRGHNTVLNTIASLAGALGAGGGYALITAEESQSIWNALTTVTWESAAASLVGAAVLVVVSQLFALEREAYRI